MSIQEQDPAPMRVVALDYDHRIDRWRKLRNAFGITAIVMGCVRLTYAILILWSYGVFSAPPWRNAATYPASYKAYAAIASVVTLALGSNLVVSASALMTGQLWGRVLMRFGECCAIIYYIMGMVLSFVGPWALPRAGSEQVYFVAFNLSRSIAELGYPVLVLIVLKAWELSESHDERAPDEPPEKG